MKLTSRKLILRILLITPIIDIINATMHVYQISVTFSFGQFIRIIFFFIMLTMLTISSKKNFFTIVTIMGFLGIRNLIYYKLFNAQLLSNLKCDLRYLYVLNYFFLLTTEYREGRISFEIIIKYTKIFVLIVSFTTLFTNMIGFGIDYAGTKRLFTEVNALTAVLVFGSALFLYDILINKLNRITFLFATVVLYTTFTQATKTGLIGVAIIVFYLLFYTEIVKRISVKRLIFIVVSIIGSFFIYYYFVFGKGYQVFSRWRYFYERQSLLSFLISGRDSLFSEAFNMWISNPLYILFGTSYSHADTVLLIQQSDINYIGAEMDLFDIGFYYGIFAFFFIGVPLIKKFIYCIKTVISGKIKYYYNFCFMILFIISFLGGHILNSPMAGVIFCIAFVLATPINRDSSPLRRTGLSDKHFGCEDGSKLNHKI